MDIRESIIQSVAESLKTHATREVPDTVQDILTIQLNQYEISERRTSVALHDASAEGMLRKFVATKRIEGIANPRQAAL